MDSLGFDHLPNELVSHVSVGCGESGVAWLDELPSIVGRLETLWSMRLAEPFPGIEYNFVAPAVRDDGEQVVVIPLMSSTPIAGLTLRSTLKESSGISGLRSLRFSITFTGGRRPPPTFDLFLQTRLSSSPRHSGSRNSSFENGRTRKW